MAEFKGQNPIHLLVSGKLQAKLISLVLLSALRLAEYKLS